ncbi:menaquinone biosynthesis protein [Pirellulaceae bacterium]|jgi:chorismate dehydratase|nr:menaquinone biosynthesis protein [Pirellulaceae bacterium]
MNQANKVKVGAVSYLNTKPLIESLESRNEQIELSLEIPSRLASKLQNGELDIALIPSVEAFRISGAKVLSDACIGCRGPVWSVKLVSRLPFSEIKTLALDEGSRTSIGLTRILLHKRFGIEPRVSTLPIDRSPNEFDCDAALVIGDRAMHLSDSDFKYHWDLGEEWCNWTGLPFVFAMWVTTAEAPCPDLIQAFSSARDFGVSQIEQIAKREASNFQLSVESCTRYLREHLNFYIGENERAAIERYQTYLFELNLIPKPEKLQFYECQTS